LKKEGYKINSKPKVGYRLLAVPDLLLPPEIEDGLQTDFMGRRIHYFKKTISTQEVAKKLAMEGAREGTTVIAEMQTGGKGRRGRAWHSPPGGIYLSILLRPRISPTQAPLLTLLAGVATARVLRHLYGLKAELKWPNDVMVGDRKICGILTEMGAETEIVNYCIMGIGINANVELADFPLEFRGATTSLKEELGEKISRAELVRKLLKEIEQLYLIFEKRGPLQILNEWRALTNTLGAWVRVTGQTEVIEGRAMDIDSNGALLVKLQDGSLKKVVAGDVSLRKSSKPL
jgi:BirA family biotin operon repressor/biotin-[acetyl-CoA-carboxylase] ligase